MDYAITVGAGLAFDHSLYIAGLWATARNAPTQESLNLGNKLFQSRYCGLLFY